MYRITGDKSLQDAVWCMFSSIEKLSRTKLGHAVINDVRDKNSDESDFMESFWLAETLNNYDHFIAVCGVTLPELARSVQYSADLHYFHQRWLAITRGAVVCFVDNYGVTSFFPSSCQLSSSIAT
ncbi:uncharacterized protein ACHE_40720A [Aspergillus chevalieri]|uniref:Class I alpha-mannosidase 1B n=1 Tax=Aspergillus chevalieri TaxID=182096 RepID=A0A7R7VNY4_ASPCH|nr:uncharacterized protein ACHE_40720A [Aspergillus chevalieri]BCR88156.1 hypothetical protein ACHE_40720A [Aspergillus chevalieri]